jgi:hypothetical protein
VFAENEHHRTATRVLVRAERLVAVRPSRIGGRLGRLKSWPVGRDGSVCRTGATAGNWVIDRSIKVLTTSPGLRWLPKYKNEPVRVVPCAAAEDAGGHPVRGVGEQRAFPLKDKASALDLLAHNFRIDAVEAARNVG